MQHPSQDARNTIDAPTDGQSWRRGFAAKVMLATSALSLAVILITSAFSYNALRGMSLKVANQALEGHARTLRHDLESRIGSLGANLRELSANALIANALADDLGREVYLRDFINGFTTSEGFQLTVVMTNFQGKPLAANRSGATLLLPTDWVAGIVDRSAGAGYVDVVDGVPYLMLAEPIIYRNTGTAEGALVFQVNLQEWSEFAAIKRIFDEAPWLSSLNLQSVNAETPNAPQNLDTPDANAVNLPQVDLALTLPQNISGAPLIVHLTAKNDFVQKPLDELLTNVAVMSGAIFMIAILISFFLARALTHKLKRLRNEASQISRIKIQDISFTADGHDEVDDLAIAFSTLVDELKQAYHQLEDESQREIELRERRFQSIINNSAEGIITLSRLGIIETFNPSAQRIFGYAENEVIGQNISMLMPEQDRTSHDGYLRDSNLHAPRIINRARDLSGLRKDGTTFPLELNVSPMELDGEQKFIGIMRDISDRKEFEDRLNAARIEAEQANLAKSQFLSSMSHELRTPLNAILGFGQILEMDAKRSLNKSQTDAVTHILKGGRHLLELIDQVLNLAKIESGNLSVSIESIDVTPHLTDALTMAKAMADKRNIHIERDIPEKGTVFVHADSTRLHQIFLNLLSNAIKYNVEGGTISLSCKAQGDVCRFEVKDTGPGIAQELHDQVFVPFNRLGAESGEIEGTGIGLTITRELINLMGGTIGFTSAAGTGALFWFELPRASNDEGLRRLKLAREGSDIIDSGSHVQSTQKILYVEDNPANLQLMEMIISRHGNLELISAHNAEIGLALAESEHPDLILMDIHLPGMSGIDAIRVLRKNPIISSIPIIAVSANAMPKDIQYALDAGFDDYLTKPINIPAALKAISDALR